MTKLLGYTVALLLLWAVPGWAQTPVKPCFPTGDSSASGATLKNCQDVVTTNPLPVETQGTPGATVGVGTGTTAAVTATLAAAAGKTTYLCGFSITAEATAATVGAATVTGAASTLTYQQPVGATPAVGQLNQTFTPCVPASTTNTAIVVTSAAAGTAGVTDVNAWGFQQ